MKDGLVTRRVVAGAAWTVPVILVGQPAAAAACSPTDVVEFTPVLGIVSTTATKPVNGHTLGTFTWTIRNDGSTTILAGTTYTATFTADKAPGSGSKSVLLTPEVTSSFNVPSTTRTLNPDGPPKGEVSVTMTLVLNVNLVPGQERHPEVGRRQRDRCRRHPAADDGRRRHLRRSRRVWHHRRRRAGHGDGDLGRRGLTPY